MTPREKEHHEIALSFTGRPFTRSQFMSKYKHEYPDRKPGAIIPSDFCVNRNPKGPAQAHPKFLRWLAPGLYEVVS